MERVPLARERGNSPKGYASLPQSRRARVYFDGGRPATAARVLKILTVSGAFYPKVDGSVVAVANLVRGLLMRGHSVTILTRGYSKVPQTPEWNGAQVERVYQRGFSIPFRFLFALGQFWQGRRLLRTNSFDVIHAHGFASLFAAELLHLSSRIPVVVTFHGLQRLWVIDRGLPSLLRFALMVPLEGILTRKANGVVAQSMKLKTVLVRLYRIDETLVHVVPNPVDVANFSFHPPNQKSKTVLFVGTFGRLYAPDLLVRAACQVVRTIPETRFTFVGQGPMMEYAVRLAKHLGVDDKVQFVGRVVDRRQLEAYYAAARMLVIPFRGRGGYILSLAALESMSVGRPVLLGYEADSTPGVIPMSNDPVAMANSITDLLNLDDQRYLALCMEARSSIDGLDSADVARKLEGVYLALSTG